MERHSLASAKSRWRLNQADRSVRQNRGARSPGDFEQKFFEFDREIVSGVLNKLRDAIHEGAVQLEMVADERMFDQSLSATLSRTARRLEHVWRKLEELRKDVAKADRYPDVSIHPPAKRALIRPLAESPS
jgi:hypothetical protein